MRSYIAFATLAVLATAVRGQYQATYNFLSQPPTFHGRDLVPQLSPIDSRGQPHPAVVENSIRESQLPDELLNQFYKNPSIAAGLARESWYGDKEFPVQNRDADKIPRSEIAKIIRRIQHLRR